MSQGHASRLQRFIASFSDLLDSAPTEAAIIRDGGELLRRLVARDYWLPASCAQSDPPHYRQYLLHVDPRQRFSVVSFG
jgi:predicted metal-dependent enzyme (double-stranded beta helix superfamily)